MSKKINDILKEHPEVKAQLSSHRVGSGFDGMVILNDSVSAEHLQELIKAAPTRELQSLELMLISPIRLEQGEEYANFSEFCNNFEVDGEDGPEYPLADDEEVQKKVNVIRKYSNVINGLFESNSVVEGLVHKMASTNKGLILDFMEKEYDTSEGKIDDEIVLKELSQYAGEVITRTNTFGFGEIAQVLTPQRMNPEMIMGFMTKLFPM